MEESITITEHSSIPGESATGVSLDGTRKDDSSWLGRLKNAAANRQLRDVVLTVLTTLGMFGIFFVQGLIIANILGPMVRGEFGTALQFPRDILLYAGLMGGMEIANSMASKRVSGTLALKYSAARLGLVSGIITGLLGAIFATIFLTLVGKAYLIPFCLICCLFVPWEHMHLTISGVDRGNEEFARYNFNRLFFAALFPILVVIVFLPGLHTLLGVSPLLMICVLFVLSKILGLLPTLRGMNIVPTLLGSANREAFAGQQVPSTWALFREGRGFGFSILAVEIFERLDVLLIVALGSTTESGFYFVAVPAANLMIVAANALGIFTFNAAADRSRKVTLKQALAVGVGTVFMQIAIGMALFFIIPFLINSFLPKFTPSIEFALWLLPACGIKGFLQVVDGYLKGADRPMIGVWARVASIFIMLLSVWLLYPQFELVSLPISALIAQAFSMLVITPFALIEVVRRQREIIHA